MTKGNPEVSKLSNKELMESALSAIKGMGFTPIDVSYGNTYFCFEGEDDSICHFHIKEIPRFFICILEYT